MQSTTRRDAGSRAVRQIARVPCDTIIMEAATPLHPDRVALVGDRLRVDALTITDPTTVRLAGERERAGDDVAPLIHQAIEIGARVLDREQTAADTDFVKAEFERQARELEARFGEQAQSAATALTASIDAAFGTESGLLPKLMERHFGAESTAAVQHQVSALVNELLKSHREALLKQFSSADEASNPLGQFQRSATEAITNASAAQQRQLLEMTRTMTAMRSEIAALKAEQEKDQAVAEEAERGTAKGRTYEEQVAEALTRIAQGRGDLAEQVGDATEGGGKKGDVVVDVDAQAGPPRGRIAFEMKTSRLSMPETVRTLDAAREQRSAGYAVLVVPSDERIPAGMSPLRELHGDKLVVTFDPEDGSTLALETAYALARARVLMARGEHDGIDAAAIEEAAARAVELLGQVKAIKSGLTAARNQIGKSSEAVEGMAKAVRDQLDEIALLARPGDADAPPGIDAPGA